MKKQLLHTRLSHTYIVLLCLLLISCGAEHSMKKGEQFLAIGEYYDAAIQFKKAYRQTPPKERTLRGQRAKRMALCYDHLNATPQAIAAYQNVIRYKQDNIQTHLALGKQLLRKGDYKAAQQAFEVVLDSIPNNPIARVGLQSAKQAKYWKEKGSRYTVKKMNVFNSQRSDFSPMFWGDEYNQLYFSSTRKEATGNELSGITGCKPTDIFVSTKDDKGQWSKPEPVQGGLNTDAEEGVCAFSKDGTEMYLTQCVTDATQPRYAKIVKTSRKDAAWSKATDVPITRDTLSTYAHPAPSPDGQWLYFTSNMPGGKGGMDIWRVRITPTGLGGVENLGEPINTPGNEMFPTFRPNGDLYFSSDGHPGLGGLDVFIAIPNNQPSTKNTINDSLPNHSVSANKLFDTPYTLVHPGYPLNSDGDDFGLTFEGPHNRGFFSSNRNNARGWDHIYWFENPEIVQTIKGWVYEKDGYELPAAQVHIVGSDGTNEVLSVNSEGSFTFVVHPDIDYLLLATCKGYLNHTEELRVEKVKQSKEYTIQFPLPSISVPVLIDNIYYDFDRATLRPESEKALDELVKLLNENSHVTIELSAHCDYKGSRQYNQQLSQQRAEVVVRYLINKGIAADRLKAVGYGKDKPKTIRKKLTERYSWLKENDVLTEAFILKQDKQKQEICNQLNRRTEFSVLRTTYGLFDKQGKIKVQKSKEK